MRAMERVTPMTSLMPNGDGAKFTADHSARVAAQMRAQWTLSNPEKVKALNEKTG